MSIAIARQVLKARYDFMNHPTALTVGEKVRGALGIARVTSWREAIEHTKLGLTPKQWRSHFIIIFGPDFFNKHVPFQYSNGRRAHSSLSDLAERQRVYTRTYINM